MVRACQQWVAVDLRSMRGLHCDSLLLALLVLPVAACTSPDDGGGTLPSTSWQSDASIPAPGAVRYRYEWDRAGIDVATDSGAWSVVNDLGYTVTVDSGFLVSASVQLSQCDEETSTIGALWNALFGIGSARAGHSSEYNPAAITTGVVESLTMMTDIDAGTATELAERFCSVHYLVAAGDKEPRSLPPDIQMVDRSLWIEGTWRASGSDEVIPFEVDTSMAWGLLKGLYPPGYFERPEALFQLDSDESGALVVVRRRVREFFDGVDFAELSPKALPTRVLAAMFDATEIAVQSSD